MLFPLCLSVFQILRGSIESEWVCIVLQTMCSAILVTCFLWLPPITYKVINVLSGKTRRVNALKLEFAAEMALQLAKQKKEAQEKEEHSARCEASCQEVMMTLGQQSVDEIVDALRLIAPPFKIKISAIVASVLSNNMLQRECKHARMKHVVDLWETAPDLFTLGGDCIIL